MEGTYFLTLLSIVMFLASYAAGFIPLTITFSEVSTIGHILLMLLRKFDSKLSWALLATHFEVDTWISVIVFNPNLILLPL